MNFTELINSGEPILTEGAIVERLKSEFKIKLDESVNHAGLIYNASIREIMASIYREYIDIAAANKLPLMLMTPTRRANKERIQSSVYRDRRLNYDCVGFLKGVIQDTNDLASKSVFIGGLMGCKGDAYSNNDALCANDAYNFHNWQAQELCKGGADYLFAGIMPVVGEASGIAMAMGETNLPYIISFMIRGNGCLLDGTSINDAIAQIDAVTIRKPIGYMVNCVHPKILNDALSAQINQTKLVRERFLGLQANTSALSPEELDNSITLQTEGPLAFAKHMKNLHKLHQLRINGGCCGTNSEHIKNIASYLTDKTL